MSATREATTREQVDAAILEGYAKPPADWISSPELNLDSAAGYLALYVRDQFWSRHECPGDECSGDSGCPAAPAWQPRLEELYGAARTGMEADFLASAQRRLRAMVEQFAAEYPYAPRAREKVPA